MSVAAVDTVWFEEPDLEKIKSQFPGTIIGHIGIELLEIGPDYLKGRMPVDQRTIQPVGILHGGASVVLAETLGSLAAGLCVDRRKKRAVGLEINANHLRSVNRGFVYGVAQPVRIGKTTQVWDIRISNEEGQLTCISRITMAVIEQEQPTAG